MMMFKKTGEPDLNSLNRPALSAAAPISISVNYNGESANSSMFTLPVKSLPLWANKDVDNKSSLNLTANETSTGVSLSQSVEPKWAVRADSSTSTVLKTYRQKLLDSSSSASTSNHTNAYGRPYTDSSSTNSSVRNDDDLLTNEANTSVQQFKDRLHASTLKTSVNSSRSAAIQPTVRGATMKSSVSVPNFDQIDDDQDAEHRANQVEPNPINQSVPKKNPLYISSENLRPNPIDSNHSDHLDDKSSVHSSTSSRATGPKPSPAARPSLMTLSRGLSSSKLNSSIGSTTGGRDFASDASNNSNGNGPKPPISKRREELAKAISEARLKLKTLNGNRTPLNTSMSVANIHRLSGDSNQLVGNSNSNSNHHSTNTIGSGANQSYNNGHVTSNDVSKQSTFRRLSKPNVLNQVPSNNTSSTALADSIRRSISLSDLSYRTPLRSKTSINLTPNSTLNKSAVYYPLRNLRSRQELRESPATPTTGRGLWDNSRRDSMHEPTASTPTPNRLGDLRISRSSSMASINRSDSMSQLRPLEPPKAPGLWGSPSSQSINNLRNSHTIGRTNNLSASQFKVNKPEKSLDSSDDESLSSDENDLYHRTNLRPSTPPKPNLLRQLRRSSTTTSGLFSNSNANLPHLQSQTAHLNESNSQVIGTLDKSTIKSASRKNWSNNFELRPAKSEYNLNMMNRENSTVSSSNYTQNGTLNKSQTNSPSSGFWSNSGTAQSGHANYGPGSFVGDDKALDLSTANPATIPLTAELFQHIVDELNHLATFAKKVYHRSAAAHNTPLCNLLSEGVSKAYVNLSTIVPPSSNPFTHTNNHHHNHHQHSHHNNNTHNNHSINAQLIQNRKDLPDYDHHSDRSLDTAQLHNTIDSQSNDGHSLINEPSAARSNSLTSDSASSLPQDSLAMNLLQQYSERLLSMVEQRISNKVSDRK